MTTHDAPLVTHRLYPGGLDEWIAKRAAELAGERVKREFEILLHEVVSDEIRGTDGA